MQNGNHPLVYASAHNRSDLVQLLLKFNPTIDQETDVSHFFASTIFMSDYDTAAY